MGQYFLGWPRHSLSLQGLRCGLGKCGLGKGVDEIYKINAHQIFYPVKCFCLARIDVL